MTPITRARLADDVVAVLLLGGLGLLFLFALFQPDQDTRTTTVAYAESAP